MQFANARQSLLDMRTSLQNRSEQSTLEVVQKMQARLLKEIASEVARLEAAIAAEVKATRPRPSSPRSSRACRDLARSRPPA